MIQRLLLRGRGRSVHISEQVHNKLTDLLGDINSPILVSTIITDLVQTKEPVGNSCSSTISVVTGSHVTCPRSIKKQGLSVKCNNKIYRCVIGDIDIRLASVNIIFQSPI